MSVYIAIVYFSLFEKNNKFNSKVIFSGNGFVYIFREIKLMKELTKLYHKKLLLELQIIWYRVLLYILSNDCIS